MRFLTALVACVFLPGIFLAQKSSEQLGPDGDMRVSIDGIKIFPVAGKPFSGSDSVDWTQTLADGSVVVTHHDAKLARDSQGRIYRERVTRFPVNSGQQSIVKEIIIRDPVVHSETTCVVASRHCTVTGYYKATSSPSKLDGLSNNGNRILSRESLGTDVIEGLHVVGKRESLTINAGVEGNSEPLTTTEEFWYSPDLEVNLSVTRKDPRQGTIVVHVVDLSRSEPDASLFQVPANFVVDGHQDSAKTDN